MALLKSVDTYFPATNFTSSTNSSLIALSPRLSKNEPEPYRTSNFNLSTVIEAEASYPLSASCREAVKEIDSVFPLIVISPVTL